MFKYYDGEKAVEMADPVMALCEVMNRTKGDPDGFADAQPEAIPEIVRNLFKMPKASDAECRIVWGNFLTFMYLTGMEVDAKE